MKYFLHDSNSFNDEKITQLFIIFGYEGLGLFYSILEKIASQEKPIKTDVLKHQLKVGKKLEKCWCFMEEIELISSNNGETFNEKLLKFSEKYKIKSEKNAKRISEWRRNQQDAKNVTHNESVCNTSKVKISKVNRSKDDIADKPPRESLIKFTIPSFEDVTTYCLERKNNVNPASFLSHYEANGWMVGKNKMKDWQAAIRTWENNSYNNTSQPSFKPSENKGHVPPSKYGPDFDPSKQRF